MLMDVGRGLKKAAAPFFNRFSSSFPFEHSSENGKRRLTPVRSEEFFS
jgi:hypothetical protein